MKDIRTNIAEIKGIKGKTVSNANKLCNVHEMAKLKERHERLELTVEEMTNLNNSVTGRD